MTGSVSGAVHSFDTSIGVDGPGARFVAFLAGCPLRCLYCHSPDTWYAHNGRAMTADELLAEIAPYRDFLRSAGGGVTLSGGEPLQQPEFVRAVLTGCKKLGLHTALDTSGFFGDHADDALLDVTDLVLLDVKSSDPRTYRHVTGTGELAPTLSFARRLADRGLPMWIRFVLVPGLTDDPANIDGVAEIAASLSTVERIEVLPFHRLAEHKYAALRLPYPLPDTEPPSAELVEQVRAWLRDRGLTVT